MKIIKSVIFLLLLVLLVHSRDFPDTSQKAVVAFSDQVPVSKMTDAQIRFVAEHYVGTQKLKSNEIEKFRVYNPDFLQLHYRLGLSAGPELALANDPGFNGNDWTAEEWNSYAQYQDWYIKDSQGNRIRSTRWNWYPYDITEDSKRSTIAQYWASRAIGEAQATQSDGVFADSFGIPYGPWETVDLPPYVYDNGWNIQDLGAAQNWMSTKLSDFSSKVWTQMQPSGIKYIPNAGQLITGWIPVTDYENSDGVMVEGFTGFRNSITSVDDWKLLMNNVVYLARRGKIVIAQTDFENVNDLNRRSFIIGSYLLVKTDKTYVNMLALLNGGVEVQWYPEYDLGLGAYKGLPPANIEDARWNGVYRRDFENGMVLVNPSSTEQQVVLDKPYSLARFKGGGEIPSDGSRPGEISYEEVSSITIPAQGAVFLFSALPSGGIQKEQEVPVGNDPNLIATVGDDTSLFYSERDSQVTGATHFIIQDVKGNGLGEQLRDDQGLYVYTPRQNGTFYYKVTTGANSPVDFDLFHRHGQTFITWQEKQGVETYRIYRYGSHQDDSKQVTETDAPIQPVISWQQNGGRVFTLYLPQDSWNRELFKGQGYNLYVGVPDGYDYSNPTPLSLTLQMEGRGSRYAIANGGAKGTGGSPYNIYTAYVRIDDPPTEKYDQGWYFGHYCDPNDPKKGVCNYLENAVLEIINSLEHDPEYSIDTNRVYAIGNSMGATEAIRLGVRYPSIFAAVYGSEPATNLATTGAAGGQDWGRDVADSRGTPQENFPFRPVGISRNYLGEFEGMGVWDFDNLPLFLCANQGRDTAVLSMAHGTNDNTVDTDTQGYPFYKAANECRAGFHAQVNDFEHRWQSLRGAGKELAKGADFYLAFQEFTFKKESFPAFSNAQNNMDLSQGMGDINQNFLWEVLKDEKDAYEIKLSSFEKDDVADVTFRRLQNFTVLPGQNVNWETISHDGTLLSKGTVQADSFGLVTIPRFQIPVSGITLRLSAGEQGKDTYPPRISGFSFAQKDNASFISFLSDEEATVTFEYGKTSALGSSKQTHGKEISIDLGALEPDANYYYSMSVVDSKGNKVEKSGQFSTSGGIIASSSASSSLPSGANPFPSKLPDVSGMLSKALSFVPILLGALVLLAAGYFLGMRGKGKRSGKGLEQKPYRIRKL